VGSPSRRRWHDQVVRELSVPSPKRYQGRLISLNVRLPCAGKAIPHTYLTADRIDDFPLPHMVLRLGPRKAASACALHGSDSLHWSDRKRFPPVPGGRLLSPNGRYYRYRLLVRTWHTSLAALQGMTFIVLGRVFDQGSPPNVDRLLRLAQQHAEIFSRQALDARRQGLNETAPEWLEGYVLGA
jgi:hypothetical protein